MKKFNPQSLLRYIQLSSLICVICMLTGCFETSRSAPTYIADKYGDKAVLYSTSWCDYCRKTRELFTAKRIDFIEIDIESSETARQEFDALGGTGIPMVLMKGRIVDGYAPKAHLKLAFGEEY